MSPLDRGLRRIQRIFTIGVGAPPPEPAPVPSYPERRPPTGTVRTLVAVATATLLPAAFGAALVPLRDELNSSTSLLMVLPVLVVALVAGARFGTIAALAAAATFDVLHTQPYYRPAIYDPDDIVETVTLLTIGVTTGYLAQSAQRAIVAARVRRHELAAVTDFLEHIGSDIPDEELAQHAGTSILSLLDARECVWRPDYRGTASPVLKPDGTLTAGGIRDDLGEGGTLPYTIEIPAGHPPIEHGRFIVQTNRRTSISMEERRAAATIATTLARCIGP